MSSCPCPILVEVDYRDIESSRVLPSSASEENYASNCGDCCTAGAGNFYTRSSPSQRFASRIKHEHSKQERLRLLQGLIHDIDNERRRNEPYLNNLIRAKEKHIADDKVATQQQLKRLYKTCASDAAQEEQLIRLALSKIQEIRTIRNERRIQARNAGNKETIRRGALMKMVEMSAQTLPLFVGKPTERIPPLCGAVPAEPAYVAKAGDMVAALVRGKEDENWILAEVVTFLPQQNKYEVDDIDEEQKDRHILSKCRVVPLPLMRANPETEPSALFPNGTMGRSRALQNERERERMRR